MTITLDDIKNIAAVSAVVFAAFILIDGGEFVSNSYKALVVAIALVIAKVLIPYLGDEEVVEEEVVDEEAYKLLEVGPENPDTKCSKGFHGKDISYGVDEPGFSFNYTPESNALWQNDRCL